MLSNIAQSQKAIFGSRNITASPFTSLLVESTWFVYIDLEKIFTRTTPWFINSIYNVMLDCE